MHSVFPAEAYLLKSADLWEEKFHELGRVYVGNCIDELVFRLLFVEDIVAKKSKRFKASTMT